MTKCRTRWLTPGSEAADWLCHLLHHLRLVTKLCTWPPLLRLPPFGEIVVTMSANHKGTVVQVRRRAFLRLALGQAQVIGATITLVASFGVV